MSNGLKRIARKLKTAPDYAKPTYEDGVYTEYDLDTEGNMVINRVQDVEPIIQANKDAFNDVSTKGQKFKGDMRHVASIPVVVLEAWVRKGLIKNPYNPSPDDTKALKRLLNSNENQFLRTCPGRI